MKKTVRDISWQGVRALVRCDFNVPLDGDGKITDDTRIRAALPTIEYLADNGARVIIMSHLGRPKGEPKPEYSLKPVAERLSELAGKQVVFAASPVVVDDGVRAKVAALKDGEIALLENVRYRKEETENGKEFSGELASLGDVFVQEAFGTAHRAHSSTAGVAEFLPAVSGFLIEKEVKFLGDAVENPERPFVAIMGGAKVGDKIKVRITVTASRDYDFVQIVDKRAACMEPVMQLSGYRGVCYCAQGDNRTGYYFDRMSKGSHIVEAEYYVDRAGTYSTGTCTVQCAYSPEYSARAAAMTISVSEDKQ